ncbi:basic salivary proline-rich protein 1-like [Phymastichus coffea]|uniref:basic salivary proline-rich protein 1-like n=1 Tax=Phymastichus coffea TaxID=108790 RepID=UPI00273AF650|nr:basic salivary proline-rich protein 1-like [Phymastichus coffea]
MFLGASPEQLTLLLVCLLAAGVLADLPPGTRRSNTYLPPEPSKPGYDYNKPPGGGFPTGPPARPPPNFPTGPPARPPPTFPTGPPSRPPPRPSRPPSPPGGGYPAPGPRPTPGFPDYSGSPSGHGDDHVHEPGMPFDFNYAVKEAAYGNDYSHNAISDGDVTRGEYRVILPDGRTQIVSYTADWKHGFTAKVTYEGTPRFGGPGAGPGGAFQGY